MINETTPNLGLPLPHDQNPLDVDVLRLRAALLAIDAQFAAYNALLQSDDATLDQVQELVSAIKANRASIADLLSAKATKAELSAEATARNQAISTAVDAAVQSMVQSTNQAISTSAQALLAKSGGTMTGAFNEAPAVTLASAVTVAIGAATSNSVTITGTTTITAFDTIAAGAVRRVTFAGALTLTHNDTSLILPGGASVVTEAGDVYEFVSLGSGNWRCVGILLARRVQIGRSATATQNFTLTAEAADGTMKLARGNAGTTTQDVMTVDASGRAAFPQGLASMPAQKGTISMVRLNTANGYGSTNTKIRRFANVVTNQGADITYADSATLGASFTIKTAGVYAISYTDNFSGAGWMSLTVNDSSVAAAVSSAAAQDILASSYTGGASQAENIAWTGFLAAGAIIRAHTDGAAAGSTTSSVQITISRVA